MKTTLNLDDELLRRAKRRAAETGTTLTAVVEQALRGLLSTPPRRKPFVLDMPTLRGNRRPTVDPADRRSLYDLMDSQSSP